MDALVEKVEQYVQEHQLLRAGERVLVGVSGGADSVGLLLVLVELSRERGLGLELIVGHVDHCIRGAKARA
ncbi:MAG: tRNA(Ile)-lysidine synthetase, partial [Phycisphaerae bacterium]|nr:tRNA(Ile)-lysidine synthetase [Phycisphaerae bacterium]